MASPYNAASKIRPPCRVLVVGPAQSGKTTLVVNLIKDYLAPLVHHIYMATPTFECQTTFDPIRHLIKQEDIYETLNIKSMQLIIDKLKNKYKLAKKTGAKPESALLLIDDLSGSSCIHGKRQGPFAHFATQCTWWNVTVIVITQQPMAVDPNFRDNAENIILLRDKGMGSYDWIRQAYTALDQDKELVRRVLLTAWQGGLGDNSEMGKHFLFVHAAPRGHTEFYIDFEQRINVV